MNYIIQIQIIAILISLSCSISGVFLILKKMSMMSDSITHTVLLGIVISYLIFNDLNSPFLIIGASIIGIVTVYLTNILSNTKLLSEDSSIGIIYPFLFSIAIILISKYTSNTHLDVDAVFLGSLEFTTFDRLIINGIDLGSKAIYKSIIILFITIIFIKIFYKELKVSTFDPVYSIVIGLSSVVINYLFMFLISINVVAAFDATGSILVISFMVGPPVTAYLISNDIKKMIYISCVISIISCILGVLIAFLIDLSISGTISVVILIIFFIVVLFVSKNSIIKKMIKVRKKRKEFNDLIILYNIHNDIKFDYKKHQIDKLISLGIVETKENKIIISKSYEEVLYTKLKEIGVYK